MDFAVTAHFTPANQVDGPNGPYGRNVSDHRLDDLDELALATIKKLIASSPDPVRVADIGSGSALALAREAAKLGAEVYAIDRLPVDDHHDVLPDTLHVLCETLPDETYRLTGLPKFDVVYSQRMVHYIAPDQVDAFFAYVRGALKPAGHVFISASGITSELSRGYKAADSPLSTRYELLDSALAERHSIHAPVCLYSAGEVGALLKKHKFSAVSVWTSPFGNIKASARAPRHDKQLGALAPPHVGDEYGDARFVLDYIRLNSERGDYYRQAQINPVIAFLLKCSPEAWPGFEHAYHSELMQHSPTTLRPKRPSVLDIGCGTGYRGFIFSELTQEYIGIDSTRAFIDCATARLLRSISQNQPHFLHRRIQDLTSEFLARQEADLILSIIVTEYLDHNELLSYLRLLYSAFRSRPSCQLLLVTCNPNFYRRAGANGKSPEVVQIQSVRHSVTIYLRTPLYIESVCREAGLEVIDHSRFHVSADANVQRPDMPDEGFDTSESPFDFWLIRVGGEVRHD